MIASAKASGSAGLVGGSRAAWITSSGARGGGARAGRVRSAEVCGSGLDPREERRPELRCLPRIEALAHHRDLESVVGSDLHLLAPMRIEEMGRVEIEEAREQPPECLVR